MSTLNQQLLNLPDDLFTFGAGLSSFTSSFDVNAFRTQFVSTLMTYMYTVFYFRHILDRVVNCPDFKCKRVYLLAKYVFVYYTFMSLFLIIFSSASTVSQYSTDTKLQNSDLDLIKYNLVLLLDGILSLLQNENLLDVEGSDNVSTITGYYNQIKQLSDMNVSKSFHLQDKKQFAEVMKNNLGNYTNVELESKKRYDKGKRTFVATVIVMLIVIIVLISLLMARAGVAFYVCAGIVLLSLAIDLLVHVLKK